MGCYCCACARSIDLRQQAPILEPRATGRLVKWPRAGADNRAMHWILAAAAAPDVCLPDFLLVIGLMVILTASRCAKTGVITRTRDYQSRNRRDKSLEFWAGYQGDEPIPGISSKTDPLNFYYILLAMYLCGGALILTAIVQMLPS